MPSIPSPKPSLQHQRLPSTQYCNSHTIPHQVSHHHLHTLTQHQCCNAVIQHVSAPPSTVWSLLRCFTKPQTYKRFVKSCQILNGSGDVGTLRQVHVVSGLPAATSTERLEMLDDEKHVMSFRVVGGEHRLMNYRSVTSVHAASDGEGSVVVESYVVDIPAGNTREETGTFVDTIVRCNLMSLAKTAEAMAVSGDAPATRARS